MAKTKSRIKMIEAEGISFELMKLDLITVDPNQPRKYFNENDLHELVESIKEKGVLQPILVRPVDITDQRFILVCGERRYKASLMAGKERIPAIVRDMTDDEAFEMQIIENLHRKDVEPLEEAEAYQAMLDKKFDIEGISLKVGKSKQYIAKKLQLNRLTDNFKKLLADHKLPLSTAYKLSRFSEKSQQEYWESDTPTEEELKDDSYKWDPYGDFDDTASLEHIPFDLSDPFLYPEGGACTNCKFNSASNTLLFPDVEKPCCYNPSCFDLKKKYHIKKRIDELAKDPKCVFIINAYGSSDEGKAITKMAEETGKTVVNTHGNSNELREIRKPDDIISLEDWTDDHMELVDIDPEENEKEFLAAMKKLYDEALPGLTAAHEKALARYNKKIADPHTVKGIIIYGFNEGEEMYLELNDTLEKGLDKTAGQSNAEAVAEMKKREERSEELDRDKIYHAFAEKLQACEGFKANMEELSLLDKQVISLALYKELGWSGAGKEIAKEFELVDNYSLSSNGKNYDRIKKLAKYRVDKLLNVCLRNFALKKLMKGSEEADWIRYQDDKAVYDLANAYIQNDLLGIQSEQYAKRDKRKANMEKKIKALKSQD